MRRVVDLTHPIRSGDLVWPGDPPTSLRPWSDRARDGYALNVLEIGEHSGTHVGAPLHYDEGGTSIGELPLERLVGEAAVVDARPAGGTPIGLDVLEADVARHGPLAGHRFVLFLTGWSRHWGTARYYATDNTDGADGYPTLSPAVADHLTGLPEVTAVGIDTPDVGSSGDVAAGRHLARSGLCHLENLRNLDALPPRGTLVVVGALPLTAGTGSPSRVIALLP